MACAGPEAAAPRAAPAPSPRPASVPVWSGFERLRSYPALGSYVSRGHPPGDRPATVRVSPEARDAYLALQPGRELPVGAVIGQFQQGGPIYVMQKLGPGRWEYLELSPAGAPRRDRLCARCHAEAVSDQLFGIPQAD